MEVLNRGRDAFVDCRGHHERGSAMRAIEYYADAKVLEGHGVVTLATDAANRHFPLIEVGNGRGERLGGRRGCHRCRRWCSFERSGRSGLGGCNWSGGLGSLGRRDRSRRRGCCDRNWSLSPFLAEARGKVAAKGRLWMQVLSPAYQHRFTLHNVR